MKPIAAIEQQATLAQDCEARTPEEMPRLTRLLAEPSVLEKEPDGMPDKVALSIALQLLTDPENQPHQFVNSPDELETFLRSCIPDDNSALIDQMAGALESCENGQGGPYGGGDYFNDRLVTAALASYQSWKGKTNVSL